MKKSLFLYLFIIAVLMNVFTYKYFSMQQTAEAKPKPAAGSEAILKDSITALENKLDDANYFALENNNRAKNYLNLDDTSAFSEKIKQALLSYNDGHEGNIYTDQTKMGEQKFIINKLKLLNHRWIIADYSNGTLWGEVILKYFVNEDRTVTFEVLNSYLYPKELN